METKVGTQMTGHQRQRQHCSPPTGSVDGRIVVEDGGGGIADLTTLTWQVALGSTLCYRSVMIAISILGTLALLTSLF